MRVCALYCLDRLNWSLCLYHAHRLLEGEPNVVLVVPPVADGAKPAEVEFNAHVEAVLAHPAVRLRVICRHVGAKSRLVLHILRLFAFLWHFDDASFLALGGALWIDKVVTVGLSMSHIATLFAESAIAKVKVADGSAAAILRRKALDAFDTLLCVRVKHFSFRTLFANVILAVFVAGGNTVTSFKLAGAALLRTFVHRFVRAEESCHRVSLRLAAKWDLTASIPLDNFRFATNAASSFEFGFLVAFCRFRSLVEELAIVVWTPVATMFITVGAACAFLLVQFTSSSDGIKILANLTLDANGVILVFAVCDTST